MLLSFALYSPNTMLETKNDEGLEFGFDPHACAILERRFLLRDDRGQPREDVEGLFRRVARAIAAVDENYVGHRCEESAETFLSLMADRRFLPNSPTLMNAGTPRGQLSGCFVLPIDDSMESIYDTLRNTALIQKSGGGTGFSFARLRPSGDFIASTRGVSSGPVSFIELFDFSTRINRLGGTRAGANMAVMPADHPDILKFVDAKNEPDALTSFNISVLVTNAFMESIGTGGDLQLRFPSATGVPRVSISSKMLFDRIVQNAWAGGDPGLLFSDRINADNPTPDLGVLEATNPCGEQPLLPYESCNLGSIDVSKHVNAAGLDYALLRETIKDAVHFLDNVIDANQYPLETVRSATLNSRKIGLGIMGFADVLAKLRIPYGSNTALSLASDLMEFVRRCAREASHRLSLLRGPFPAFSTSTPGGVEGLQRNATVTSIAPTGTISQLAGCSSGIEPHFALAYRREVMGTSKRVDAHPVLVQVLEREVRESERILEQVRRTGRLPKTGVPAEISSVFATAHEIAPVWHVRMQAAFQTYTDTGVSKTVNLPHGAGPGDVAEVFQTAFSLGCKGITVFRDGCRSTQVIRAGNGEELCPDCAERLINESGCLSCPSCGYTMCTI